MYKHSRFKDWRTNNALAPRFYEIKDNNLRLYACQVKDEQYRRSTLEVKDEQIRLLMNELPVIDPCVYAKSSGIATGQTV